MEPFVTLWHWPLPLWLTEKGGVKSKDFIKYFSKYVGKIASEFQNEVKFWIILNEPEIYTSMSYLKAHKNKLVNRILKKIINWWWNFYFLNQIKNEQDFIGLNHYFHNRINYGFNKNANKVLSDIGWEP